MEELLAWIARGLVDEPDAVRVERVEDLGAVGQAVIARAGYPPFFLVATAFAALSFALVLLLPESRRAAVPAPSTGVARDMMRTVLHGGLLRLMVATVLFGVGMTVAFYFVAPYTRVLGLDRATPFFAAYATTTIALRILGRRLLGRLGTHRIAAPVFAVFALGLATLCALPAPGILVLAGVACGAGHGSLFPILNALTVARTPPHLHGTAVGLYTGALDLGAVVGMPAAGAVAQAAGYRTMFALTALACLGGLAIIVHDHRRHSRKDRS